MSGEGSPQTWESCPFDDHANVTPSDSHIFDPPFRGIWVGTGGSVVVTSKKGNDATYKAVSGSLIPVVGIKVKASGTDASDLVAGY